MTRSSESEYAINEIRIKQALTASHEELHQLVHDPDPVFLITLLSNSNLSEEHLLNLLKRRDLDEKVVNKVYRANRAELSHRLRLAIVRNPAAPSALIRNLLPDLRLFELLDLCILPGSPPDHKLAAEHAIIKRLPTAPLGNKITLARRANTTIVGELIKEGQPQVLDAALSNPHLKEAALFQFLKSAKSNAETISMIARHNRWKNRPNLRMAILKNPKAPDIWLTLWLPQLNGSLQKQLRASLSHNQKKQKLISEYLRKNST